MIHLLHHQVKPPGQRVAQKAAQVTPGVNAASPHRKADGVKAWATGENEGSSRDRHEHKW